MNRKLLVWRIILVMSAVALAFVLRASTPTPVAAQRVHEWNFQAYPGQIEFQNAQEIGREIEEATGGRIRVRVHQSGAIVPNYRELQAVRDGVVEMSQTWLGGFVNELGVGAQLLSASVGQMEVLPYMAWYLSEEGQRFLDRLLEDYGLGHFVAYNFALPEHFGWCRSAQIRTIEDLRGKRYRAGGYYAQVLNQLGARGQFINVDEVFTALERGVLDCAELGGPELDRDFGMQDVGRYVHVPGIHQMASVSIIAISRDAWQALTPDLQATVDAILRAHSLKRSVESWVRTLDAYEELSQTVPYIRLSPELQTEIRRVTNEVLEEAAEGDPLASEILASQRSFTDRWQRFWQEYAQFDFLEE